MKKNDLLYLADLNFAEFHREMARWHPGSEIYEHNNLLLIAGADSTQATNGAIRTGEGPEPSASDVMDRVHSYFTPMNRVYSIYIRRHRDNDLEKLCKSRKMKKIADQPGLAIDAPLPEKPLPEGTIIRHIDDARGASDFVSVTIDSYQSLGMTVESGEKIFQEPERMLRPSNRLLVAYWNGRPVSCAMCMLSHSIAGIYWVGTVRNARGKGLGESCTRAAANEAFRLGASRVVLQASRFGEPIYRRMGFDEITRYPWYIYGNII